MWMVVGTVTVAGADGGMGRVAAHEAADGREGDRQTAGMARVAGHWGRDADPRPDGDRVPRGWRGWSLAVRRDVNGGRDRDRGPGMTAGLRRGWVHGRRRCIAHAGLAVRMQGGAAA